MPRSYIHGLDVRLATDTIVIIRGNLYWSVDLRIASVVIRILTDKRNATGLTVQEF